MCVCFTWINIIMMNKHNMHTQTKCVSDADESYFRAWGNKGFFGVACFPNIYIITLTILNRVHNLETCTYSR